jgi:hypothetical protein
VARFLSKEWFAELQVAGDNEGRPGGAGPAPAGATPIAAKPVGPGDLVVDVVVSDAPEGEVRYQLVVDGERPRILSEESSFRAAQVKLTSDYGTVAGIASGRLSALEVLSGGRVRLSGDVGVLSPRQSDPGGLAAAGGLAALSGLDLLPPPIRTTTTF